MKQKKSIILILFLLCILCGCSSNPYKSITVETDNKNVQIKLNTSNGLDIYNEEQSFIISKDETTIAVGYIYPEFVFDNFSNSDPSQISTDSSKGATVLAKDENTFYYELGNDYTYMSLIDKSTIVLSTESKKDMELINKNISFEIQNKDD